MFDQHTIYDSFGEAAFRLVDKALDEMPSHAAKAIKELLMSGDATMEIKLVLPNYHIQCELVKGSERTSLFEVEAKAVLTH